MQLVVNVTKGHYKVLQKMADIGLGYYYNAILKGTPLPENHGRIGDLSELETRISDFIEHHKNTLGETNPEALVYMNQILDKIKDADTLIEAESERSENDKD